MSIEKAPRGKRRLNPRRSSGVRLVEGTTRTVKQMAYGVQERVREVRGIGRGLTAETLDTMRKPDQKTAVNVRESDETPIRAVAGFLTSVRLTETVSNRLKERGSKDWARAVSNETVRTFLWYCQKNGITVYNRQETEAESEERLARGPITTVIDGAHVADSLNKTAAERTFRVERQRPVRGNGKPAPIQAEEFVAFPRKGNGQVLQRNVYFAVDASEAQLRSLICQPFVMGYFLAVQARPALYGQGSGPKKVRPSTDTAFKHPTTPKPRIDRMAEARIAPAGDPIPDLRLGENADIPIREGGRIVYPAETEDDSPPDEVIHWMTGLLSRWAANNK